MNETFVFNAEDAKRYGVNEAVMLTRFRSWIRYHRANDKHRKDGRTWCFNSAKALQETFPWWSVDQIRRILRSLQKQGVLRTMKQNAKRYDQTTWYAFEDEESQLDVAKSPTRSDESANSTGGEIANSFSEESPKSLTKESGGKRRVTFFGEEHLRLASLLADLHRQQDDGYNPSSAQLEGWANDIRLLTDRDNRLPAEVERVIRWAKRPGGFWFPNIMSGRKLREKYPQLLAQMQQDRTAPTTRPEVGNWWHMECPEGHWKSSGPINKTACPKCNGDLRKVAG